MSGYVDYVSQVGSSMSDRSSFDLSVPYTVCCNYRGYCNDPSSINQKFCLIENSGSYSVGDAATKVLLAKDVVAVLNHSFVDFVPKTASDDIEVSLSIYVGTVDDVVDSSTVYLYRYKGYVPKDHHFRFDIPDISKFVVPSGKNIVVSVTSQAGCYVSGNFVSSVDD